MLPPDFRIFEGLHVRWSLGDGEAGGIIRKVYADGTADIDCYEGPQFKRHALGHYRLARTQDGFAVPYTSETR